jgi:hypothetical protein
MDDQTTISQNPRKIENERTKYGEAYDIAASQADSVT